VGEVQRGWQRAEASISVCASYPVMDAPVYPSLQVIQMQSQPERLVMENLCTSLPLLPPYLINNTLIYYLHFEVFLHGNLKE